MVGKASKPSTIVDALKYMNKESKQNYGLLRAQTEGAPLERSTAIGTALLATNGHPPLDSFGGVMQGALAFRGIATAELAASGILSQLSHNASRLYINNDAGNTLKVILPVSKGGGLLFIRGNGADAIPIQNTAGSGNETTGNIETIDGNTYTLTGADWLALLYDQAEAKWFQITIGQNLVGSGGGGGGEVFTWTANHSADGNSLTTVDDIDFYTGGSNQGHINSNSGGLEYSLDSAGMDNEWWVISELIMQMGYRNHNFYSGDDDGVDLTLNNNSVASDNDLAGLITFRGLDDASSDSEWGEAQVKVLDASTGSKRSSFRFLVRDELGLQVGLELDGKNKRALLRRGWVIKSQSSVEIGYQVDAQTMTVGSRGSVQVPTDTNTGATIGDDGSLTSLFGDVQGCMGVTGLRSTTHFPILWVRSANGAVPQWWGTVLSTASSP